MSQAAKLAKLALSSAATFEDVSENRSHVIFHDGSGTVFHFHAPSGEGWWWVAKFDEATKTFVRVERHDLIEKRVKKELGRKRAASFDPKSTMLTSSGRHPTELYGRAQFSEFV